MCICCLGFLFLKYRLLGTTPNDFDSVSVSWDVFICVLQTFSGLMNSSTPSFLDLFSSLLLPNMSIPESSLMQAVHGPYIKKHFPHGYLYCKWYSTCNLSSILDTKWIVMSVGIEQRQQLDLVKITKEVVKIKLNWWQYINFDI